MGDSEFGPIVGKTALSVEGAHLARSLAAVSGSVGGVGLPVGFTHHGKSVCGPGATPLPVDAWQNCRVPHGVSAACLGYAGRITTLDGPPAGELVKTHGADAGALAVRLRLTCARFNVAAPKHRENGRCWYARCCAFN